MKKVTIITNIPTPYRIPLFNELDKQLTNHGVKLNVVFAALGYPRRKWAIDLSQGTFEYTSLQNRHFGFFTQESAFFAYAGLIKKLIDQKPDAVIVAGFSLATLKVCLLSLFNNIPYIIWSGDIARGDHSYSSLRIMQRKFLVKKASAFIAYGSESKDYLFTLGADTNKIHIGVNTVDTEFFVSRSKNLHKSTTGSNRLKRLLYVGELSPRKNVLKLLQVVYHLSRKRSDFILDIIGDGEELSMLKNYVDENSLSSFVSFKGFKQKSDIARSFSTANCFLFQTDFDIWGLVLVEAMASGLPCIASIHAGATKDLVKDGLTGYTMDFSETPKVTCKIECLLDNADLAKAIGLNASQYIQQHVSLEKSASGFVLAIGSVLKL